MKTRYRIWHKPVLSFYSKPLYRDISTRWRGTNLGYLFLLLAVCLLPAARMTSLNAVAFVEDHAARYLMQIPQMQITDGRVSVEAPQPYSIIGGNTTVLLIDTTGKINSLDDADAEALLTATHLYIDQGSQPPMGYDLSSIKDFELNEEIATGILERIKHLILPAYYAISLLYSFVLFLLGALLCGTLALLIGLLQKKQIDYAAGLRLSVAAFTPPLILSTLCKAFGCSIPAAPYLLLALAYLYIAVGACPRAEAPDKLYLDEEPVKQ
jgi:hypothetical protein